MIDLDAKKQVSPSLNTYLIENGLLLDDSAKYQYGIDFVEVSVEGKPVFIISLPPVSNYEIDETEYTRQYLKQRKMVS